MVTVSNNFTVTGISAFQNNLNITGSLSTQGNITVSGSTSLDGNVSITGSLVVDGSITERSSLRFKENIQPLNDSLSKINKLEGVSFTRNGVNEIGMIAEEVEKVLPEVVSYDTDNNPLGIEYSRVTSVLIEGIKDLYTIIRNQERRINELEAKK